MSSLFTYATIDITNGPDWTAEAALLRRCNMPGSGPIAGVDEVGRGPLAGPVVAAAVILDPDRIPCGLNDSKKLSAKKRENLYELIINSARAYGIASVSVEEIDQMNILEAAMLAMRQSVAVLDIIPAAVLVDGNRDPLFDPACITQTLVKGDARSLSIAAASIIAKVTRDRLMTSLSKDHPGYGWESNAGYGSEKHRAAINEIGITPHHRRSFSPVKQMLAAQDKDQ